MSGSEGHSGQSPPQLKRRRITRACDKCHRGGIKCSPGPDNSTCGPCASFGSACTYNRPAKRRGPPSKLERQRLGSGGGDSSSRARREHDESSEENPWKACNVAPPAIIEHLVDAFYHICYPIHIFFHWPTFSFDVRRRRYLHDRPFFAVVMGVCAMASARLRDRVLPPGLPDLQDLPPSESFYDASCSALPTSMLREVEFDFDYKRATALLCQLCIHYGWVKDAKYHLGIFRMMNHLDSFHNESKWPPKLNAIEVEERRRLFWAGYQQDVYSSIIWGTMMCYHESQITVAYPTETFEDDEITVSGILPSRPRQIAPYIRGWRFVTDLYRILEHATSRLRASRIGGATALDDVTGLYLRRAGPKPDEVLGTVAEMYNALPIEFKQVKPMTGRPEEDRYGYQATNIIITLQTLRSVVAGTEDANVNERCACAAEMLDALAAVPMSYIQACSVPTLHHLAGVGHLLGSVIQSPLSQNTYLRVRTVLLALADMLASLETAVASAPDVATRMRAHVSRIDTYMAEATFSTAAAEVVAKSAKAQGQYNSLVKTYPPQPPEPVGTSIPDFLQDPTSTSTSERIILPDNLFADWIYDFGQGDVFDWLGVQANLGDAAAAAPIPTGPGPLNGPEAW